jgi:hypothetical protein
MTHLVAFNIGQILGNGNDGRKERHEASHKGHFGRPYKGCSNGILDSIIDPKVQQESSHSGNGESSQNGVLLGPNGWHGIDETQEQAERIETK